MYLLKLAFWKSTFFTFLFHSPAPGRFLRAGDVYSPTGLVNSKFWAPVVLKLQFRDVSTRRQHFLIPYRWKGRLRENRVECARRNTQALCPFPSSLLHFTAQKNTIICQICALRVLYTRWATVKKGGWSWEPQQQMWSPGSFSKLFHSKGCTILQVPYGPGVGRVSWIWTLWFLQEGDQGLHVQEGIHFLAHPLQVS